MVGRNPHPEITDKLVAMLRERGASRVALFGSFARGDHNESSDIDLLVTFTGRKGLLELIGIEQELSDTVHRRVDLITEAALSDYLRPDVERDAVVLYG